MAAQAPSTGTRGKPAPRGAARGAPANDIPPPEPPAKFAKGTASGNASAREIIEAERAAAPRASTPSTPPPSAAPSAASPPSRTGPVSLEPSGPVPQASAAVATGSGPHGLTLPSSPDEALAVWNDVLGELEARRKFTLLGPFQLARVMKWTADEIELGFPVDVHSMGEMASERQTIDDLRALLHELVPAMKARNGKVTVRMLDANESQSATARSVLETTRERGAVEKTKREAEAREHPITKHVLQTFGAQIKEIKTDV